MIPDTCISALRAGGLVAFPTDTFFALSCDALRADAVSRLRRVKGTGPRPLPVLIPRGYSVDVLGCTMDARATELATRFWPGKLTVVLPCRGPLARQVGRSEDGAVGLRVPDHPVALEILERWNGPLVGTSANRSGEWPASRDDEVRARFGTELDCIVPGVSSGTAPSTVVVATGDRVILEREGAIRRVELAHWMAP